MMSVLDPIKDVWPLARRFAVYLRPVRASAGLVAFLVLTSPLIAIAALWLTKVLIDEVFVGGRVDILTPILLAYVIIISVQIAVTYATTRIEAGVTERIAQDVRVDLYRHIVSVSPGTFHKRSVGDFLAHFSGDVGFVEYLIYSGPLSLISNVISAAVYLGFLLVLSWKLTLCAVLTVPLLAILSARYAPLIRRASRIARRKETAWVSRAEERLAVAPLIHAFGTQAQETQTFDQANSAARKAALQSVAISARLSAVIEVVASIGGLMVLAVGAYEMHQGHLTIGTLLAFLGSVGSLFSPVRSLAKASGRFNRAAASAQRVLEILDLPSLVQEKPDAKVLSRVRGSIEFRDVRFGYNDGPDVLHGVSLRVEAGETLALVGPNGGGKSTLIQLAMRLYDPSDGAVLVDDIDVRDVSLESLRRAMTIVFQDSYIVKGSIRENVVSGATDEPRTFLTAAKAAHVHAFADKLAAGYGSPVGPRGAWLSEGQRQRIALARALYRK
jgi:ATP-binding cassette subfamily B protein